MQNNAERRTYMGRRWSGKYIARLFTGLFSRVSRERAFQAVPSPAPASHAAPRTPLSSPHRFFKSRVLT